MPRDVRRSLLIILGCGAGFLALALLLMGHR